MITGLHFVWICFIADGLRDTKGLVRSKAEHRSDSEARSSPYSSWL